LATLALEKLYLGVQLAMSTDVDVLLPVTSQTFGWREPEKQLRNPRRIVWVPGDDGDAGVIGPPRYPGAAPNRALFSWDELFTVYIANHDATAHTVEFNQWVATRTLADQWLAELYRQAHGTFGIVNTKWVDDKKEHRYGATLRIVGGIQSKVADKAVGIAPIDTMAEITPKLINPPGTGTDDILIEVQPS